MAAAAERLRWQSPGLIMLCTLMDTEWVLRSRYRLDKASIAAAFGHLLESRGVTFEHEPTVQETLYLWFQHPSADFADCLLAACAAQLGRTRFVTFGAIAAKPPNTELLACVRFPCRMVGRAGLEPATKGL